MMQIKLAESAGFCFGVKRAVELCEKTSASCGQCKTLGPIIHNGNVVERLKEKGVFAINSVDEVETGETVIIRSHGALLQDVKALEEKGAIVEKFDLGLVEYAIPTYYVIACAEASSNLARYDGVKYGYRTKEYEGLHDMYKKSRSQGFGAEVKRRIMLGSFVLSAGYYDDYYLKALKVKALIKKAFDEAFKKYDVILGPVAPTTAPKIGESFNNRMQMYLNDIYTISANLAGLPAISLPCGIDSNGLPIGLQLIGDCFNEKTIIRAAYSFEQSRGYLHSPFSDKTRMTISGQEEKDTKEL